MAKFIDLTGKLFTYLKVIERVPNRGSHIMWLCECICGRQKAISGNDLRSGKTKGCGISCDYAPRQRFEGKVYGKITVVKLLFGERSLDVDKRQLWQVKCECGNLFKTTQHALNPGKNRNGLKQCMDCNKHQAENRLVGKLFYYLRVIKFSKTDSWGSYIWECLCRCGNVVFASTSSLERSATKSCGCYTKERLRTHGKSKTPLYRVWNHVRRRCNLSSDSAYGRYGGRGITICSAWLDNFAAFESWSLLNGYIQGLQLDRIDVDQGYSPVNCQYISKNCNSAFAWIDKMSEGELRLTEIRMQQRRVRLQTFQHK